MGLHKSHKILQLDKILHQLAKLTCCDGAAELAREIVPETDSGKVALELQKADDAFTLTVKYGAPYFARFYNPSADIKRAEKGSVLSPRELLNVAGVLEQTRILKNWKKQWDNIQTPLNLYFNNLAVHSEVLENIKSAIISEEEIDDNASAELSAIRRKIRGAGERARTSLEKIIRSSTTQKYLMDPIITIRDGRFVVPVKAEHRGDLPGLIHDSSSSGATLFVEPMSVVEANNEIKVLAGKEEEEIRRILSGLSAQCADCAEDIENNYSLILIINLYFAKAELGARMGGVKPAISKERRISLKKARHPLIDQKTVVPIDITLGGEYWGLIITGPNTGGKTVSLKTLGLLTLMAQCGLMIPVGDGSEIAVFDNILADIGDEQSIEQNLSTFSAHITNIISIIEKAGANSLVLLDELGSGTDPTEGAAIAISIIEELKVRGCLLAATTHYAELKLYALNTDNVENASCEFDVESLRPTYRLLIGTPGRSNAFAISGRLGMPKNVLDRARGYVSGESRHFENVVESLEQSRLNYEKELSEVSRKNAEIEKMRTEISALKSTIQKDKERTLSNADEQTRRIIENVRAQANEIIDDLENIRKQKGKQDVSALAAAAKAQLSNKLDKLYEQASPNITVKKEEYRLPRELKVGDEVIIADVNQRGYLLSTKDNQGYCQVQAGIMKIKTEEKNLRLAENPKQKKETGFIGRNITSRAIRDVNSEINLIGMNADEALMELDNYIDNCVMGGLTQIRIVHGKGTGILRTAVGQHLKRHPNVKSHRLGTFGEGENGVTIAELI